MNTGNTYYFIDDFNKICKCENGMKSDESIVLETYELVDDVNRLIDENEQLRKDSTVLILANQDYRKENEQLKEEIQFLFNQIKAFREDCRTYQDFDGASTITRLIEILEQSKEIFK